jgi:hypothetical protein
LELRVGRSHELAMALDEGAADGVVAMRLDTQPNEVGISAPPTVSSLRRLSCRWRFSTRLAALGLQPSQHWMSRKDPTDSRRQALRSAASLLRSASALPLLYGLPAGGARGVVDESSELDLPTVPDAVFSIRLRHDADIATDLADLLGAAGSSASAETIR